MVSKAVSVRVDPELWRRLKVKAAEDGVSVSSLVEAGMVWALGPPPCAVATMTGFAYRDHTGVMATAPTAAFRQRPKVRPTQELAPVEPDPALTRALASLAVEPDAEARCQCGQLWKNHQSGASGKLAAATNCRQFREG